MQIRIYVYADSPNQLELLSKSRFEQAITCGHVNQIAIHESLNMEPLSEKLMYNLWYYSNSLSIANDISMAMILKEELNMPVTIEFLNTKILIEIEKYIIQFMLVNMF